jgi:hypothetical protein
MSQQLFHDLPIPAKDWPIAGPDGGTVPVDQDTSTIQAFGISSNGLRIVGTHLSGDESRVITFSQILGSILPGVPGLAPPWVADPISIDSEVSGRGINNEGDVVGFMLTAANDPNQTVPYFRPGNVPIAPGSGIFATLPTALQGAEIILPDDRTASSKAMGINNHEIVVGYYVDPDNGNSVGFSLDLRLQTAGVGLANIGKQIPNADSDNQGVQILSINDAGDMLATSDALGNLVGLVDQHGQRKWFPVQVLNPEFVVVSGSLPEVKLMGINNKRTIVGFISSDDAMTGFYCQVFADGKTSPATQISHPAGSGTQFHGISDHGVICGTYKTDAGYNHPFVYELIDYEFPMLTPLRFDPQPPHEDERGIFLPRSSINAIYHDADSNAARLP